MDTQQHNHNHIIEENTYGPSQILHLKSDKYNFIYERIKNEVSEPIEDPLNIENSTIHSKSTEAENYSFRNDVGHEASLQNAEYYVIGDPINITEWKRLIGVQQSRNSTNNSPSWFASQETSADASNTAFLAISSDSSQKPISDDVSNNMGYNTCVVPGDVNINIVENKILSQHSADVNVNIRRPHSKRVEKLGSAGVSNELETLIEAKPKGIKITMTRKNKESGRVYDKFYSCLYCRAKVTKLSMHLNTAHRDKARVRALLTLPINSKERKYGFVLLGKEGNYQHNCQVLESNEGELILTRRPGKMEAKYLDPSDYEPCPRCFGFVMKTNMWRHKKSCWSKVQALSENINTTDDSQNSNICVQKRLDEEPLKSKESESKTCTISDTSELGLDFSDDSSSSKTANLSLPCTEVNAEACDSLLVSQSETKETRVSLSVSRKNKETGNRIYDKLHSCLFCQRRICKISRHLQLCHKNQEKVKSLMTLPMNSKARLDGFAVLVREGDYHHNCRVIESGQGELILARRPDELEAKCRDQNDYDSCPHCLGFTLKKHLWRHKRVCFLKKQNRLKDLPENQDLLDVSVCNEQRYCTDEEESESELSESLYSPLENGTDIVSKSCKKLVVRISPLPRIYGQSSSEDNCDAIEASNGFNYEETSTEPIESLDMHHDPLKQFPESASFKAENQESLDTTNFNLEITPPVILDFLNSEASNSQNHLIEAADPNLIQSNKLTTPCYKPEVYLSESSLHNKIESEGIKLSVTKKKDESGNSIYDKMNSCLFCRKKIIKIGRHLLLSHKDEERVKSLAALPLNSKERIDGFALLVREGNYYHNCRVLESNEGELILARRPGKHKARTLRSTDYEPCSHCLGFIQKKYIHRHLKRCPQLVRNFECTFEVDLSPPDDTDHEDIHLDSAEIDCGSSQLLESPHEIKTENSAEIQGASMVLISLPLKVEEPNSSVVDLNNCDSSNISSIKETHIEPKEAVSNDLSNLPDKESILESAAKICVKSTSANLLRDLSEQSSSEIDIVFCDAANATIKFCDSNATSTDDEAITEKAYDSLPEKNKIKRPRLSIASKDQNTGARIYDKVHSCLFCQKKVVQFSKHMLREHKNEERVKLLMKLPKNSKKRADSFALLLREGDYVHNCRVLESNEGELILARRPGKLEAKTLSPNDYEPCPTCLGFIRKNNLWKHKNHCLPVGKNQSSEIEPATKDL